MTLMTDVASANTSTIKQQQAGVAAHGSQAPPTDEILHTTTEHPFLTVELGWVNAQDLKPGEHVRRLDGTVGVVVGTQVVAGVAVRYNLTVANEHTYAVGTGLWVVHNTGCQVVYGDSDLSKVVQDARKAAHDKLGNYAAGTLDDGSTIVGRSSGKGSAGIHAEQNLIQQAEDQGKQLVSVYSEYEPCAQKCSGLLNDHNPYMDISWSWAFNGADSAATSALRDIARIAKGAAVNGLF